VLAGAVAEWLWVEAFGLETVACTAKLMVVAFITNVPLTTREPITPAETDDALKLTGNALAPPAPRLPRSYGRVGVSIGRVPSVTVVTLMFDTAAPVVLMMGSDTCKTS
jgi:hypothetical protein